MQPINHPLAPEELMAYLDGELPAAQAVGAASHLERCAECRSLADALRSVSQTLAVWEVEPSGLRAPQYAMPWPALPKVRRKWFGLPPLAWGLSSGMAVLLVAALTLNHDAIARFTGLGPPQSDLAQYGARLKAVFSNQAPAPPGVAYNRESNRSEEHT